MRPVINVCLVLGCFLAVPLIPFLILGEPFEQDVRAWIQRERATGSRLLTVAVAGVLASDIFLPIPSSSVVTFAGGTIGLWPAALWSWLGMNVGACAGFGLARLLGAPFARRLADARDLESVEAAATRFGPAILLLTRPLPILAEACVLLTGTTQLTWRRFLPPIVTANLGIAIFYAACGAGIQSQRLLAAVAVVSGTIPLLVALAARRYLVRWKRSAENTVRSPASGSDSAADSRSDRQSFQTSASAPPEPDPD